MPYRGSNAATIFEIAATIFESEVVAATIFFLLPRFLKKFHRPTPMKKVVILAQFSRNFIVQPLWKNSYFDSIVKIFMG